MSLDNKLSRQWKGTLYNWQGYADMDNDTPMPRCLTQRQIAILLGALIPMRWLTRWIDAPDDIARYIDGIEAALQTPCDGTGDDMILRQSPDDNCTLQYSIDGGITWVDAFDYALCASLTGDTTTTNITNITEIVNAGDTITNNYTNLYDGTPGSIVTGTPSREALCWAYRAMVGTAVETWIEYVEEQEAEQDALIDLGAVLLGAAAATVGFFAGGPPGSAAFAAAVVGAYLAAQSGILLVWSALDTANAEALRDHVDYVVCNMLDSIDDHTPTFVEWQTILAGYTSPDTDQQKALDVMSATLSDESAYVVFLGYLEELRQYEAFLPACPCQGWCRWSLFGTDPARLGTDGWTLLGGTLTPTSIYASEIISGKQYVRIEIYFEEPVTITAFDVQYTLYNSSQVGGAIQIFLSGSETYRFDLPTGIDRNEVRTDLNVMADRIHFFLRDTQGHVPNSGVNHLKFSGDGTNPFAGGNNCPE